MTETEKLILDKLESMSVDLREVKDKTARIEDRVTGIEDKVAVIEDRVTGIENKVCLLYTSILIYHHLPMGQFRAHNSLWLCWWHFQRQRPLLRQCILHTITMPRICP